MLGEDALVKYKGLSSGRKKNPQNQYQTKKPLSTGAYGALSVSEYDSIICGKMQHQNIWYVLTF